MEINEEEWELINDDGFVYKRLKRPRLDSATTAAAAAPQRPDPAAEAKAHRERKKTVLLKLKTKYQQEILHWEHLSNTLKALQERTQNQPPPTATILQDQTVSLLQENSLDSSSQELTDTLLSQVGAQEATICEVSRLCDVAEALCNAEEQRLKQPFIDLPVWGPNPRELMTSLLEE